MARETTKALRKDAVQLRRYGGKPSAAFCGSDFMEGLQIEMTAKGQYSQTGFAGGKDIGVGEISLDGLTFKYDPTLDDLGYSKRCYVLDPKRGPRLRPMEGEDNKTIEPERPYNYAVFLKNMFWTGGMTANQPNANGIYEIA